MTSRGSGMTTFTTSWTGHYMEPAFLACLHWALGDAEMMKAYRAETGDAWQPACTGIDRIIDEQTGAELAFLQRFSAWLANVIFGRPEDLDATE
jgi:hypothetical protein